MATESIAVVRVTAPPASATWVAVGIAAIAMVATLPGRTHGLGLITEPLLHELEVSRVGYAAVNLWATLLGALFCVPWGWLIDRFGARFMLGITLALLGSVVVIMSEVRGDWYAGWPVPLDLFVLVLLTRGLGQSGLSVVSITLVGRLTGRRSGLMIGVYSFLSAAGFAAVFAWIKLASDHWQPDWRELWAGIGWSVLMLAPLAWLLRPLTPNLSSRRSGKNSRGDAGGLTLGQALWSPAFWVFALATSLYGLVASGVSLFNEAILKERGFDRSLYLSMTAYMPIVGLVSNLATGWLVTRWRIGGVLGLAMLILAAALVSFPLVETLPHVYLYATAMGIVAGMITVIFFAVWSQAFGTAHLGRIQGAAQMLTVFGSALGPLLLAVCQEQTGSYVPMLLAAAALSALLAMAGWYVPMPAGNPRNERKS